MSSYRSASSSSATENSRAATPNPVAGATRVHRGSECGLVGIFSGKRTSTLSSKHGRSAHLLSPGECDWTHPTRTATSSRCSWWRSLIAFLRPANGAMERASAGDRSPRWRRCIVVSRQSEQASLRRRLHDLGNIGRPCTCSRGGGAYGSRLSLFEVNARR